MISDTRTRLPELYLAVDPARGQLSGTDPAWLAAILRGLPGKADPEAPRPTAVIRTQADRAGGSGQSQPWAAFHDWRDTVTRDYVLKAVVSKAGFAVSVETAPRHALPHGRTLRIQRSEGTVLEIMLDQGFGYWRSRSGAFDFAASASEQASLLFRGDIAVVGSPSHPTILILDLSNAAP
jgi:hypothetical protein